MRVVAFALALWCTLVWGQAPALPTGPNQAVLYVQPDDGIKPVLDLINSAQSSIWIKIYLWTSSRQDVIDALGQAVARGVKVRVLLEAEPGGGRPELSVYQALRAKGAEAKFTLPFRYVFVHEKSMIVDQRIGWISTSNITASSFSANREYQVVTTFPLQVAEMVQVFEADWKGERSELGKAQLVWAPSRTFAERIREGNARETVLGLIHGAQRELWVQQAGMADEETTTALIAAVQRGVKVHVIGSPADPAQDTYFVPGAERLRKAGALLRYLPSPYVHAKVIMADDQIALVGSINLSANSMNANRELGILLNPQQHAQAFARLKQTLVADFAAARPDNPFVLPPLEGVIAWSEAPKAYGRIVSVEGQITAVEDRSSVAFLRFDQSEEGLRLVVFPRSYGLLAQPFPQAYLGQKVRARGRVVIYAGYYEIIIDTLEQLEILRP